MATLSHGRHHKFLNGEFKEDVYITQPQGFSNQGFEHLVCKLKKAVYVLGNRFIGKVIGAEPVLSRWRACEGELVGQNLFCTNDLSNKTITGRNRLAALLSRTSDLNSGSPIEI